MNRTITDLTSVAETMGIRMKGQKDMALSSVGRIEELYGEDPETIKTNFDGIVSEIERIAYDEYLKEESDYGKKVFKAYSEHLCRKNAVSDIKSFVSAMGKDFKSFDRFFLSLSQSRKARAGKTFELIHNTLFQKLDYPFTLRPDIAVKPDFVIPSIAHYRENPFDCILFASKRTLRERWRLIPSFSNKGTSFFLATIDKGVSENQLKEMMDRGIRLVVPKDIKDINYYSAVNVLSFREFFEDHLDISMKKWRRDGII